MEYKLFGEQSTLKNAADIFVIFVVYSRYGYTLVVFLVVPANQNGSSACIVNAAIDRRPWKSLYS